MECTMEEAEEALRDALKPEKFGVVSVVDIQKTLKKKINKDIRPYLIIGACSPPHAFDAIEAEDDIGVLMPCNVLLQETEPGKVKVSFQNPLMIGTLTQNPKIDELVKGVDGIIGKMAEGLAQLAAEGPEEEGQKEEQNKVE